MIDNNDQLKYRSTYPYGTENTNIPLQSLCQIRQKASMVSWWLNQSFALCPWRGSCGTGPPRCRPGARSLTQDVEEV